MAHAASMAERTAEEEAKDGATEPSSPEGQEAAAVAIICNQIIGTLDTMLKTSTVLFQHHPPASQAIARAISIMAQPYSLHSQ